jgi:glycerol-3-phosphate acyltransferase PlsX
MKPIALDAMGGDFMPRAAVAGAALAVAEGIPVVLVGDENKLREEQARQHSALHVHHATDVIGMTEQATDVRHRKGSSIMQAMALVQRGEASACVSMGHSGATMAAALLLWGRIEGVERPAILTNMPVREGFVALLDAGANADCRPKNLQQFAVMGAIYARAFYQKANPSVGLMSIGEEEGKGNELVRAAYALLKKTPNLNFYGNVEGRDLFKATTDVVVTDGFTGNVVLKLAEGEARELFSWVREALMSSLLTKLGAALVKGALKGIARKMDPAEVGAQPLLGVNGYAFIGHGTADERAVLSALRNAHKAVSTQLLDKLKSGLAQAGAGAADMMSHD